MIALDFLTVILVDKPGRERDALRAMLASTPLAQVHQVLEECPRFDDHLLDLRPDVVIIKVRLMDKACLEHFKMQRQISLLPRYLVIVDTMDQYRAFIDEGVDKVLMTGFTNNELYNVLEQFVTDKIKNNSPFPF